MNLAQYVLFLSRRQSVNAYLLSADCRGQRTGARDMIGAGRGALYPPDRVEPFGLSELGES